MSLFIPKPKILYAPMLATFGGGSIGGFKSSGGPSFDGYDFAVGQSITFVNGSLTEDENGVSLAQARAYHSSNSAYQYSEWGNDTTLFNVWQSNGYQDWVVPQTGRYNIYCAGARGGNATYTVGGMNPTGGANGGAVEAKFDLTGGSSLRFICGSKGTEENNEGGGGGGGGSFVFFGSGLTGDVNNNDYAYNGTDAQKKAACMLAAGGGGSASHSNVQSRRAGQPAYSANAFTDGRGANSSGYAEYPSNHTTLGHGTNGSGGAIDQQGSLGDWSGGAGSGILSSGQDGRSGGSSSGYTSAGHYGNGFKGATNSSAFIYGEKGGFGGGGRGSYSGSGGGGYSGGAGDWSNGSTADGHGGGGGGNFINSSFSVSGQGSYVSYSTNTANRTSHGTIVITRDS